MKYFIFSLLFLIRCSVAYSQIDKNLIPQKSDLIYKKPAAQWVNIPAGILRIGKESMVKTNTNIYKKVKKDSIYVQHFWISKTEITNMEYLEFMESVQQSGNIERFKAILPDTNVWSYNGMHNLPYILYYLRHPAYRHYPVVGISHAAAQLYCEWLTEKYNKNLEELLPKLNVKAIQFRLPTVDEWMYAAKGGNEFAIYPWGSPYVRSAQKGFEGDFLCNFRKVGDEAIRYDDKTGIYEVIDDNDCIFILDNKANWNHVTAPVKSYWPNPFGLYNMAGNVAEMTTNPQINKGGSWFTGGYDAQIEVPDPFEGETLPKSYIGFRPVFIVIN